MTDPSHDSGDPTAHLFTLDEANALLPRIAPALAQLKEFKERLDRARVALDRGQLVWRPIRGGERPR